MSNKDKKIKNKIGETAYQFLIRNFGGDFLAEHLPNIFGNLPDIRKLKESDLDEVKSLLNEKLLKVDGVAQKEVVSPFSLLDKAGFELHIIKEKQDYEYFKKYYKQAEILCKFDDYDPFTRFSNLFWITRKGFETIKRANNPSRQDEYGTSCMSIGISQDTKNVLQICNRYNHGVPGCDNTYNSNLDNIVKGLTEAFNKEFDLSLNMGKTIEFTNFYVINNKYYYYDREINGNKIGGNTVNGIVYDPGKYIVFDNYILNLQEKSIKTIDDSEDGFVDMIKDVIKKGYTIHIYKKELFNNTTEHKNKIIILI